MFSQRMREISPQPPPPPHLDPKSPWRQPRAARVETVAWTVLTFGLPETLMEVDDFIQKHL